MSDPLGDLDLIAQTIKDVLYEDLCFSRQQSFVGSQQMHYGEASRPFGENPYELFTFYVVLTGPLQRKDETDSSQCQCDLCWRS